MLSDVADDLRKGHANTAAQLSRVDLVLAFLQHASGGTKKASTGVMLQAVTDLSAKFVRTACGQRYEDVQQLLRVNKKTTSSGPSDHVLRLRQLAKKVKMEPTAACDETKVVLSDSEGMPLVSDTLVRLLPQRPCTQPTQVRASIVEHPEPIRGHDSAYHPLELQWIIRTYICPKDSEHEWVSGKHNTRLRAHIIYWVEKGWLGGARLNVRLNNESVDLTKEGKAAFHRARTALKRHYDKIELHGWKLKLNYWSQHGRPRVMTAAEREECCRRLHRAGYDVEFGDWDEAIHNHLLITAAAIGTTGPEFVPHASTDTIKSTMVLNDLNAGAMATKTGTTSTLTQTVVRQEAGQSIRATHQLAAVVFASNYFPIEATHPRWVEFAPTMTVDDKMVCEAAGCCMIPAQACMVSSTDATSEWIQLNAGKTKVKFPAQRLPGRVVDRGDAGVVEAASEAGGMDLTSDCDDPDALAMARATARLSDPDMVCDIAAPGPLTHGTAGAAPTHTVGNRFDAVKQASRKPANMVSMSLGVNIQLTFAAVSRVTMGVACAMFVFTRRQLPAVLVHATHVPQNCLGHLTNPWVYVKGCSLDIIPVENKSGIVILAVGGFHGACAVPHEELKSVWGVNLIIIIVCCFCALPGGGDVNMVKTEIGYIVHRRDDYDEDAYHVNEDGTVSELKNGAYLEMMRQELVREKKAIVFIHLLIIITINNRCRPHRQLLRSPRVPQSPHLRFVDSSPMGAQDEAERLRRRGRSRQLGAMGDRGGLVRRRHPGAAGGAASRQRGEG